MVWRYFDKTVEFSKRSEFLTWTETAALPFKFSSPYRIAAFLMKKGFETKLIIRQEAISESKAPLECCQVEPAERKLFLDFFKAHNAILRRQIASAIVDKRPILSDIREALLEGGLVILLVDSYYTLKARGMRAPYHLPHWVVVTGCEDKKFYINDSIPETGLKPGKIMVKGRVLRRAMDTYPRFGWSPALIVVRTKADEKISHCPKERVQKVVQYADRKSSLKEHCLGGKGSKGLIIGRLVGMKLRLMERIKLELSCMGKGWVGGIQETLALVKLTFHVGARLSLPLC